MKDFCDARLDDAHIRPLMEIARGLRQRGFDVPNVDPADGGVGAKAMFLLESPGPRAVGTNYVSRDNPDPSARNMGKALDRAGFARPDVLLWNVVPYCVSSVDTNRNATAAQIRDAVPYTQAFIDELQSLAVVILCGRKAQRVANLISLRPGVQLLKTFHPGAQSYNRERCRADIHNTFALARGLI